MADLNEIQAAQSVKIIGSSTSGVESTPVAATVNGGLHINIRNDSGTELATTGNPLRVDPTGTTTQPISGTITANQGGTWNINNITGTVSLPTGAATSALQTTINTTLLNISGTTTTSGTTLPTRSLLVGGDDGTNIQEIQVRTSVPNISTIGAVTRIIPYEPATFVISSNTIVPGNNKSMIALFNGTSSTVILKLQSIKIINNRTAAATGVVVDFRLRRITGLTAGTSITPLTFDTNDSLNVNVTAATGGTVSGEATTDLMRRLWSSDEWGTGTTDVESNDHVSQQNNFTWMKLINTKPITIRANQGLTLKCVTNTTASDFDFELIFTQEVP